jgi:deoxyribose-phosphate aldolase
MGQVFHLAHFLLLMDIETLKRYIDHTILKPDATQKDIEAFLKECIHFGFYAAVMNPCWVNFSRSNLPNAIKVCSVVGFPLGASSTSVKQHAAHDLILNGCDEIDMVMNIGKFRSKDYSYVGKEIGLIKKEAGHRIVKVIIETCLLTDAEKRAAARIVMENGADFVKTSTGFSLHGATVEDVVLLHEVVGSACKVKASGGIRDYKSAISLIKAGASRLGTSAGPHIIRSGE